MDDGATDGSGGALRRICGEGFPRARYAAAGHRAGRGDENPLKGISQRIRRALLEVRDGCGHAGRLGAFLCGGGAGAARRHVHAASGRCREHGRACGRTAALRA